MYSLCLKSCESHSMWCLQEASHTKAKQVKCCGCEVILLLFEVIAFNKLTMGWGNSCIVLPCAHSMFRLTLNNHIWARIRFHTQYKFLHIQMVVCSLLSLVTDVVCSVLSLVTEMVCSVLSFHRCLYLRTYNCIIVPFGDHCGWIANCGQWFLKYNTCIQLHTTVWKYSCNNTHHHQWPCYSLFVQAVNVSTTDNSSMHRVWTASRETTFVDSAPSPGRQLRFSTCQRKTTVHRIAQQIVSHWVKWSNSITVHTN